MARIKFCRFTDGIVVGVLSELGLITSIQNIFAGVFFCLSPLGGQANISRIGTRNACKFSLIKKLFWLRRISSGFNYLIPIRSFLDVTATV